jgi:ATP-binding cassette subfamily B (MDR/TAP) protein 1
VSDENKNEWSEAMQDEINYMYENDTFELEALPKGKKALNNKCVYRMKTGEHSSQPRYKAKYVVKGFGQKKDIDFDEKISQVTRSLQYELCVLMPPWTWKLNKLV